MTIRSLLPVLLILFQTGVMAARTHAHPALANHTQVPHVHVHDLFDLFGADHEDDEDDGDDDHDHDAVDLSNVAVSAAPSLTVDEITFTFPPIALEPLFSGSVELSFPVGLPPSTAGPHRPLYLTFCTLTI